MNNPLARTLKFFQRLATSSPTPSPRVSGYYAWIGRDESDRSKENRRLLELIEANLQELERPVRRSSRAQSPAQHNHSCSRNHVVRLMRVAGLRSKISKKFRVKTTNSNHEYRIASDLIGRDFTMEKPDRAWVSDITYIRTDAGWLYLAATMDLYSRMIVGWSMSSSLHAKIVMDALQMGIDRRASVTGLIHHSDRGVQCACDDFRKQIRSHEIQPIMSRKGNCYDNAVMESFFHTLKVELVHHEHYQSRSQGGRASLTTSSRSTIDLGFTPPWGIVRLPSSDCLLIYDSACALDTKPKGDRCLTHAGTEGRAV